MRKLVTEERFWGSRRQVVRFQRKLFRHKCCVPKLEEELLMDMSMLFASEKETGSFFFTPVPSHLGVINPASINDITRLGIRDLFHGVYIALGLSIVDALTHD